MVASSPVLVSHEVDELVVDLRAMRQEEGASWSMFTEKEEILLRANGPVVSLNCFLLESEILSQLILAWKRDSIYSLQGLPLCITQPVCLRIPQDLEGLDVLRRWNMWTGTQIDEVAYSEDACDLVFGDFLLYELCLEFVIAEQVEGLFLREEEPLEAVVLVDD